MLLNSANIGGEHIVQHTPQVMATVELGLSTCPVERAGTITQPRA